VITCEVVGRRRDDSGREVVEVDTGRPWHIKATTGEVRFEVWPDQLVEFGWGGRLAG
jgi:hypothetical protein